MKEHGSVHDQKGESCDKFAHFFELLMDEYFRLCVNKKPF